MICFCCGMSRSGSTVQYQLVSEMVRLSQKGKGWGFARRELVKEREELSPRYMLDVFKSEPCDPWMAQMVKTGRAVGIGIIRDPRDVAVSLDRFYRERSEYRNLNDYEGFDQICGLYLESAIRWQSEWESLGIEFLRYGDYWPRLVNMAWDCNRILELKVDESVIQKTMDKFARAENMRRIDELECWHDGRYLLTKAHIGPVGGKTENWRNALEIEQVETIERLHGAWMIAHGYKLETLKNE